MGSVIFDDSKDTVHSNDMQNACSEDKIIMTQSNRMHHKCTHWNTNLIIFVILRSTLTAILIISLTISIIYCYLLCITWPIYIVYNCKRNRIIYNWLDNGINLNFGHIYHQLLWLLTSHSHDNKKSNDKKPSAM